ncbi:hypothetical protein LTR02_012941 [Friedmanniomyces endolithicus]|nr:hypothetical protein LTR02_012941 [Friedmanniomyces endolithicus]
MKILIAGITGNIGQHAASYALSKNHVVRGLGRSPSKLAESISLALESFVTSSSYYDIAALDRAVAGVDAIICAYGGMPELHLDAQLLLFRAAERAGVRRFLAAGWNYDWRVLQLGEEPIYDAAMMFHQQVALTSEIKPCHIFSGMLAEVFFGVEGQDGFTPEHGGVWDPVGKKMEVWGSGEEEWCFTTEEDAGKWGVEVVTAAGAEEGGFVSVCSWRASMREIKECYEKVRGGTVGWRVLGDLEQLRELASEGRKLGLRRFWEWHRYVFMEKCVSGVWNLEDVANERFPDVRATSMEEFIRQAL